MSISGGEETQITRKRDRKVMKKEKKKKDDRIKIENEKRKKRKEITRE